MMKKWLSILLVFTLVLSFAACTSTSTAGQTSSSESTEAAAETTDVAAAATDSTETAEKKIVVAGINLQEDQFSSWCALGYQAACDDYGVTMLHAISGGDPAKEVELLSTYAAQDVDGIAIMPASETTSVAAIKQIYDTYGIPISLLNSEMNDTYKQFVVGCVTTPHSELGRPSGEAAAEYIRDNLGGQANIGIITFVTQYSEPATERMNGFVDAVKAINPGVVVVAQAEAWVQDMAIQAAGDMITAHPEINVIFACNDGGTVGTVMAVKNAGMAGKVAVFGIDGGEQQIAMLRSEDNILQAVTAQDAYGMGYQTMEILIKYIKGEYTPTGENTNLPGTLLKRGDTEAIDAYEKLLNDTKS